MFRIILLCLVSLAHQAHANAESSKLIDQIAGVYKKSNKHYFINGDDYTDEDVLEIVKVDDNTIYFKTKMYFNNGHQCFHYGVGSYTKDHVFIHKGNDQYDWDKVCDLAIIVTSEGVRMIDDYNRIGCKNTGCGFRGHYNETWKKSLRRPIRYMKLLKNSKDYKEALQQINQDT